MLEDRPILLFRRDFKGLTGGHLKVWHYYNHAERSKCFIPRVYLTPESTQAEENPWRGVEPAPLRAWQPAKASALFLAGLDWEAVPKTSTVPVINLIQGFGHCLEDDPRRQYLDRAAIRICVSQEVADGITATGMVNGPVHVIPNGIDLYNIPSAKQRDVEALIVGFKQPIFAKALALQLKTQGVVTTLLTQRIPRDKFLHWLSRSRVVITLPHVHEGFFLPALEAMAAGAIVICPDCIGNRQFCRDGETCFRPVYDIEAVKQAALKALSLSPDATETMRHLSSLEASKYSLEREQSAFLGILDDLYVS